MKLLLAMAITLLVGCTPERLPIPASAILDSPAAYNGRTVRICGLLTDSLESCHLSVGYGSPDPEHPDLLAIAPSMWLNGPNGTCAPGNQNPMGGGSIAEWALVEGTFHTGGHFGHLGLAEHQLNATKIELVKQSCEGVVVPNNSFKPTPLRGAA